MEKNHRQHESPEQYDIPAIQAFFSRMYRTYNPTQQKKYKPFEEWEEKDKQTFAMIIPHVPYDFRQAKTSVDQIHAFFTYIAERMKNHTQSGTGKKTRQEIQYDRGQEIRASLQDLSVGYTQALPHDWDVNKILSLYNKWIKIWSQSSSPARIDKRKSSFITRELFMDYIESPAFVTAMRSREGGEHRVQHIATALQEYKKQTTLSGGTQLDLFLDLTEDIHRGDKNN